MSTLFDLGGASDTARAQRVLDDAKADHWFGQALDHAVAVGGRSGLARLQDYSARIAAAETQILDEHVGADGNTRQVERMLDDGKTSRRNRVQKAQRAKAVAKNRGLGDKLASRAMSEEQVDVIAAASEATDGAAAVDDELIDKVAAVPPEQGKVIADTYVADHKTAGGIQTEHDRQRALRQVANYFAKKYGLNTIGIGGDAIANKKMWAAIEARAEQMYQADGGRDVPASEHPRTHKQRLFDAAYELICGITLDSKGDPTTSTADKADSAETDDAGSATDKASPGCDSCGEPERGASTGTTKPTSRRYTPPKRPAIVISLALDKTLGLDPETAATQIGYGLIPDSTLRQYANDADIIAALFDRTGMPLWFGRLRRYASETQRIALMIRDGGCVLCGADPSRCQAHHITPWESPAKGHTNLNKLVLLCTSCHRQLHANHQTIYQDTQGTWRTRPATPAEIAPDAPTVTRQPGQTRIVARQQDRGGRGSQDPLRHQG